jgi:hypothetical protein
LWKNGVQGKIWRLLKKFSGNLGKKESLGDSAIRATSSAYIRAFIILDGKETLMFSFSSISERSFIKIENRVGERIYPCLTPKS